MVTVVFVEKQTRVSWHCDTRDINVAALSVTQKSGLIYSVAMETD